MLCQQTDIPAAAFTTCPQFKWVHCPCCYLISGTPAWPNGAQPTTPCFPFLFHCILKEVRTDQFFLTLENHLHLPILVETSNKYGNGRNSNNKHRQHKQCRVTNCGNLSLKSVSCPSWSVLKVMTLTRMLSKATSMCPPRPPPLSWEADSRTSLAWSHWPIRQ